LPRIVIKGDRKYVKFIIGVTFVTLSVIAGALPSAAQKQKSEKPMTIKEYEAFHHLLHPLQHEALPKNDFATIRNQADELAAKGEAIVALGVPAGTSEGDRGRFESELQNFSKQLNSLTKNAKEGSDAQLKESFEGVHDSFELLASMLPKSQ
jgi:hypothetical protein